MPGDVALALAVTDEIRRKAHALEPAAAQALVADLGRIEAELHRQGGHADPYAQVLDITDLQARLRQSSQPQDGGDQQAAQPASPPPQAAPAQPPPAPPQQQQTGQIGERLGTTLESVDFTGFVASLITGTFKAIVDSSAAQMREYAKLVSSIATTLEDFTGENVSLNQARDHLAQQYPQDLLLRLPAPGTQEQPRLTVRPERSGQSPDWLQKYGLEGQELTDELVEGPLLEAGRKKVGEGRMSSLATMVLMGVNRIVVNEGDIRAKVQFHAAAVDVQRADYQAQTGGFASRDAGSSGQVAQMLVSTLKANAQADAAIKADLMGEVRVSFKSEVFPLERFADSAAIQLINRHAKWRNDQPAPAAAPAAALPAPAPAPAAAAPAPGGGK